VDYLILTEEDKRRIELDRIRTLECAHYAAWLELDELRHNGVPDESPPVQRVIKDLVAIEATLALYHKRVVPDPEQQTGDDGADSTQPVGEEAPK
jgi:hypothetical protein